MVNFKSASKTPQMNDFEITLGLCFSCCDFIFF